MNKRIKQLTDQATQYADGYDDRHEPIWWQFYNERFAEMVVLECADHLSKLGEFNSSQNIKNHFGIEE